MLPLPWWALFPVLLALTAVMQREIFHMRALARQFWISTYLRSDSPLAGLLKGTFLLNCLAVCLAFPLSVITYIVTFTYDCWDCLAVCTGVIVARLVHYWVARPLDANLAQNVLKLAHLRVFSWLAIICVLVALAFTSILKSAWSNY